MFILHRKRCRRPAGQNFLHSSLFLPLYYFFYLLLPPPSFSSSSSLNCFFKFTFLPSRSGGTPRFNRVENDVLVLDPLIECNSIAFNWGDQCWRLINFKIDFMTGNDGNVSNSFGTRSKISKFASLPKTTTTTTTKAQNCLNESKIIWNSNSTGLNRR